MCFLLLPHSLFCFHKCYLILENRALLIKKIDFLSIRKESIVLIDGKEIFFFAYFLFLSQRFWGFGSNHYTNSMFRRRYLLFFNIIL